jgi:hypothetical protein
MGGFWGFSVTVLPAVIVYCVAQDVQAQQLYISPTDIAYW